MLRGHSRDHQAAVSPVSIATSSNYHRCSVFGEMEPLLRCVRLPAPSRSCRLLPAAPPLNTHTNTHTHTDNTSPSLSLMSSSASTHDTPPPPFPLISPHHHRPPLSHTHTHTLSLSSCEPFAVLPLAPLIVPCVQSGHKPADQHKRRSAAWLMLSAAQAEEGRCTEISELKSRQEEVAVLVCYFVCLFVFFSLFSLRLLLKKKAGALTGAGDRRSRPANAPLLLKLAPPSFHPPLFVSRRGFCRRPPPPPTVGFAGHRGEDRGALWGGKWR